MTQPPTVVEGPLGTGATVYGGCASCHGAAGGGGVGYQFSGGEVLKTFPHIEDQIRWVTYGTEGYNAAGVEIYGNPEREGGPHVTGALGVMPQFGTQLTQDEIVAVVCHERYDLGGADPTSTEYAAEYDAWCAPDAPVYAAVQDGTVDLKSPDAATVGTITIMPVGPAPVAGSPATAPAG
jgi:mono/diheme cytochrome c family protein